MNESVRFRNVLKGKNEAKPPFIPFALGLAARTANVDLVQMVCDSAYQTNAMESLSGLLGLDTIIVAIDEALESEALGAEVQWPGEYDTPITKPQEEIGELQPDEFTAKGRIPVLLETVKRLSMSHTRDKAIACVMTGPCAFIEKIKTVFTNCSTENDETLIKKYGGLLIKLVRSLCEQKIDAVFFREDTLGKNYLADIRQSQSGYKGIYGTIFNIVKAYNATSLIVTKDLGVDGLSEIIDLIKPGGIVPLWSPFDEEWSNSIIDLSKNKKTVLGLPLEIGKDNEEKMWSRYDMLNSIINEKKMKNIFYCSNGDIPYDLKLEVLLGLMDEINDGE